MRGWGSVSFLLLLAAANGYYAVTLDDTSNAFFAGLFLAFGLWQADKL